MQDRTRANQDRVEGQGPPVEGEIPFARDLTSCVLTFVRDRVTPVADWVAWTGGDPDLVLIVIGETLRSIADGLEGRPPRPVAGRLANVLPMNIALLNAIGDTRLDRIAT